MVNKTTNKPAPPIKPINAYFLFVMERRPEFEKKFPDKNTTQLSKLIAAVYRELPDHTRKKYEDMYEKALKKYTRDHRAYIDKYGYPNAKKKNKEEQIAAKYTRAKKQWDEDYKEEHAAKRAHLSPRTEDYKENAAKQTHLNPTAKDYKKSVAKHTHLNPTAKNYKKSAAKHTHHKKHLSSPIDEFIPSGSDEISYDENYACEVEIEEEQSQQDFEDDCLNDNIDPDLIEEIMTEENIEDTKHKNETFNLQMIEEKMAEEKIEDVKRKDKVFNLKMVEEKIAEETIEDDKDIKLKSDAFNLFDLYMVKSFVDIIFEVGDKDFSAHKLILSKRSKFFDNFFKNGISDGYRVRISDAKPEHFEILLRFIYGDPNLTVNKDSIIELLVLSDKYQVPALRANCELALVKMLNLENFPKIAKSIGTIRSVFLKKALCKFVAQNAAILKGDLSSLPKPILIQIFTGFAALAK